MSIIIHRLFYKIWSNNINKQVKPVPNPSSRFFSNSFLFIDNNKLSHKRILNANLNHKRKKTKKIFQNNPFDKNELLQRLGKQCIRKKTTSNLILEDTDLNEKELKSEKWLPIYRFHNIHFYSFITKFKFLQTIGSILLLPYCYYEFLIEEISSKTFFLMGVAAIVAPLLLIAFTRYFNKIVGVISINEQQTIARIGHLSYWGGRKNKFVALNDIIPLDESPENPMHSLLKLKCYSNKDFFLLSTKNVEIIDFDIAKEFFGTIDYFTVKK